MTLPITIDERYLTDELVNLIQLDSRNPDLTPNVPGEKAISLYLCGLLEALGLEVHHDEVMPNRFNAVGIWRGTGGGHSLMLNGHTDTVNISGMSEPFSGAIRDGRVYGRGSQDMKSGVIAMLAAVKSLRDAGVQLAGDVVVALVCDEEYASFGTIDVLKRYRTDSAIVTEPTDLILQRAHRGFIWYDVNVYGRAAHGSRYREGVDAILHMGRFLARLDQLEQSVRQRVPHPLTGVPSLHASIIEGGTEISVYPSHCRVQIERRTNPNETVEQNTAELQAILDELHAEDATFRATVEPTLWRPPFEVSASALIVQVTEQAMQACLGDVPPHGGASFWTDAALLAEAGIETVLLGATGAGLHSDEEWVELASVVKLAHILADVMVEYCGVAQLHTV